MRAIRKRIPRGATIGMVLAVAAIALTMAFTVAGIGFSQVNLQFTVANRAIARDLAESVVARAMEKILSTKGAFGGQKETLLLSANGGDPRPDNADAVLTFQPGLLMDVGGLKDSRCP